MLYRATRRACSKSPETLTPASLTFVQRFVTSPRTELARNSTGSENPFEEHNIAERTECGDRRTGYEQDASGPARRARRLRARPPSQIRQSPPRPGVSSSSDDGPDEMAVGALRKHQVSKELGNQAVPALIDPGVNI